MISPNYDFFEPYAIHSLYLPPDFCQFVMESDYCPSGWREPTSELHGSQIPFDEWDWLTGPGRGIKIHYRLLNSYTLELYIQQHPGNDWGNLTAGMTRDLGNGRSQALIVWTYFNSVYPGGIHGALLPPHPFAIISYYEETPVVRYYRDEPWGD
ncbi:hypothetical protein ES703_103830 [subsurface metagenome]